MAMPELETIPPVVTSIGWTSSSLPPPMGASNGTGRTRMSTTQDPHNTQSKLLFVFMLKSVANAALVQHGAQRFESGKAPF